MARLNFFTIFRLELGIRYVDVKLNSPTKLKDVLLMGEKIAGKPFMYKLIDNDSLLNSAIVLINGKNAHHLQELDTMIKDEDEIALFPPGGGG